MLSEHFSKEEFSCYHCGELPPDGISKALIKGLETLRLEVGLPIHVTSGYRCKEHNEAVGGVEDSQHVQGCAADIWVDGYTAYQLGAVCQGIFDGVGIYATDNFVHVDMRDNGRSVGEYLWEQD